MLRKACFCPKLPRFTVITVSILRKKHCFIRQFLSLALVAVGCDN